MRDPKPSTEAGPLRLGLPEPVSESTAEPLLHVGVAAITSIITFCVLQLWRADMTIPFHYSGDSVYYLANIQGIIENSSYWWNPRLGAPGVQNLLDFPAGDHFGLALIGLISLFSGNAALSINIFYLLGYPAVALTSSWSLRRLGLSRAASGAMSILYAFLPYHLLREEYHLFLSAYFLVPLAAVLAIELAGQHPPLVKDGQVTLRGTQAVFPIVVAALTGIAGVYYAFFTCFFFLLAGLWRARPTQDLVRVRATTILVATIIASASLSFAPNLWYRLRMGANDDAVARGAGAVEVLGLKITQLLLPVQDHRFHRFAILTENYQDFLRETFTPVMQNESNWASLGIIAAIGFIFLLFSPIFGIQNIPASPLPEMRSAALLTVGAVFLATTSGFNFFVALVLPEIRAYNRISVFIAFFAFFAFGIALDREVFRRRSRPSRARWPIAVLVVTVGILDQTTPAMVPNYEAIQSTWRADQAFTRRVDESLPQGAMVYQLPYIPFPEAGPLANMADYDHLKPYLHSSHVHWSYGAMRGREASQWQQKISVMDPKLMIAELKNAGFVGIWINRRGYEDSGTEVIRGLREVTGSDPEYSRGGEYVFFSLD